jgi:cullin 3
MKNYSLAKTLKEFYKSEIFDKMNDQLISSFLSQVELSRKGTVVDLSILKSFINFLTSFDSNTPETLYTTDIENSIIEESLAFYRVLIPEMLNKSFINYLSWGIEVVKKEDEAMRSYLPSITIDKIILKLKELIFFTQAKEMLERHDGFIFLLKNKNNDLIGQTYDIFSQEQKSLHILLAMFKDYIKEEFTNLITKFDSKNEEETEKSPKEIAFNTNFIEEFIQFQTGVSQLIVSSFKCCNLFNVIFKEILEITQTSRINFNSSYVLPFYLDKYLKRSTGISNSQMANFISDQVMLLFPFAPEKDIFIHIHRNLLSTRILTEDFISMDSEKYLINKLKLECGIEFTANVEAMISDYITNKDLNEKLSLWQKENTESINLCPKIDINVK